MLVKKVTELTEENAGLLAESRRLLKTVEDAFTDVLQQAKDVGELGASKDPARIARFLQMQLMGLRSYGQSKEGTIPVDELLEDAFSCLN